MDNNPFIEVCRIIHDYDRKHEENLWWEARLITPEGEKVIHHVDYIDESRKFNAKNFLQELIPIFSNFHEINRQSDLLSHNANSQLVAFLLQEGWEPVASNEQGMVTMMKRNRIK